MSRQLADLELDTVLFDMDGLLIDSERLSQQTFNETIADFGLPEHNSLFIDLIGRNAASLTTTITSRLGDKIDVDAFQTSWNNRYVALVDQKPVPLKPGVHQLLTWLREENIKTAVATSTTTQLAQKKLESTGILDYFQIVIGGDQVTHSKPDPEIYLKAANAVSADTLNTLVLEDSSYGVQAGVAANFHVIQVPDIAAPTSQLLALGHHVCVDLHDVLVLLKSKANSGL